MTIGLMTMDKKFHWRTPSGTSLIISVILEETCSGTSGLRTVVIAGSRDKHTMNLLLTLCFNMPMPQNARRLRPAASRPFPVSSFTSG